MKSPKNQHHFCHYKYILPADSSCTDLLYQISLPKHGIEVFTSEAERIGCLHIFPATGNQVVWNMDASLPKLH